MSCFCFKKQGKTERTNWFYSASVCIECIFFYYSYVYKHLQLDYLQLLTLPKEETCHWIGMAAQKPLIHSIKVCAPQGSKNSLPYEMMFTYLTHKVWLLMITIKWTLISTQLKWTLILQPEAKFLPLHRTVYSGMTWQQA